MARLLIYVEWVPRPAGGRAKFAPQQGVGGDKRPESLTLLLSAQRRFISDAAHQLRTPLAAIQAQLYSARHSPVEAPQQQALAQMQQSRSLKALGKV